MDDDPFLEGHSAVAAGLPVTACPYKPGSPKHARWQHGWTRAQLDDRTRSGQASSDTMAAKGEAALAFRRAGYGRADPVEELLGHSSLYTAAEAREYLAAGVRPTMPEPEDPTTILETWPRQLAAQEAAQKALRRLAAGMTIVGQNLATWIVDEVANMASAFGELASIVNEGRHVVKEGRHGAAAVCPRHGPTKGGLCRKCQRQR